MSACQILPAMPRVRVCSAAEPSDNPLSATRLTQQARGEFARIHVQSFKQCMLRVGWLSALRIVHRGCALPTVLSGRAELLRRRKPSVEASHSPTGLRPGTLVIPALLCFALDRPQGPLKLLACCNCVRDHELKLVPLHKLKRNPVIPSHARSSGHAAAPGRYEGAGAGRGLRRHGRRAAPEGARHRGQRLGGQPPGRRPRAHDRGACFRPVAAGCSCLSRTRSASAVAHVRHARVCLLYVLTPLACPRS